MNLNLNLEYLINNVHAFPFQHLNNYKDIVYHRVMFIDI